jgi:hypothetical protein
MTYSHDKPVQSEADDAGDATGDRFKGVADLLDRVECWIPTDLTKFGKKYQKHIFLIAALVTSLLLLILGVAFRVLRIGDGVSVFNLCVDIVVGVFMVWALYWAASEFVEQQSEPKLWLVFGKRVRSKCESVKTLPVSLTGETVSKIHHELKVCLWLEGEPTKVGRQVRVEIKICSEPPAERSEFPEQTFEAAHYFYGGQGYHRVTLQFKGDMVVYPSTDNYLGFLNVVWKCECPPEKLDFVYRIFTPDWIDGKYTTVPAKVDWQERESGLATENTKRSSRALLTALAASFGVGVLAGWLLDMLRD